MAIENLNLGTDANSKDGDSLRAAMQKLDTLITAFNALDVGDGKLDVFDGGLSWGITVKYTEDYNELIGDTPENKGEGYQCVVKWGALNMYTLYVVVVENDGTYLWHVGGQRISPAPTVPAGYYEIASADLESNILTVTVTENITDFILGMSIEFYNSSQALVYTLALGDVASIAFEEVTTIVTKALGEPPETSALFMLKPAAE